MKKASQARVKSKSTVNSPEFTVRVEEITLSAGIDQSQLVKSKLTL